LEMVIVRADYISADFFITDNRALSSQRC